MKTTTVPFDIYIPATESRAAIKVETIHIEVLTDPHGNELVTPESSALIDKTQARYMGLLAAADIRALRDRLAVSQDQLSDALGCGKKSLSRWENGREYPSQLVNTLLRLLDEGKISLADLRAVRQPRHSPCESIVHFIDGRRNAPRTYNLASGWRKLTSTEEAETFAM
jgi:DNA-binding transcriptional regulator YiaG